jgi:hypothetical protein
MQRGEGDQPHNTRSKGWHKNIMLQCEELQEGIQRSKPIAQWTLPAGLPLHVNEKLRGDDTDHGRAQQEHRDNDDSIHTPPDITGDISVDDDVKRGDCTTSGFKATLEKLRYVATKPNIVEKEVKLGHVWLPNNDWQTMDKKRKWRRLSGADRMYRLQHRKRLSILPRK